MFKKSEDNWDLRVYPLKEGIENYLKNEVEVCMIKNILLWNELNESNTRNISKNSSTTKILEVRQTHNV